MIDSHIIFHSEEVSFNCPEEKVVSQLIFDLISLENKSLGVINYIFCSDDYLLKINQQYLRHDTYTDIITFNYVEEDIISGDIFISIDRVKENALELAVDFEKELKRVMIHGVLHLVGYDDKSAEDAREIRAKEDFYLTLRA